MMTEQALTRYQIAKSVSRDIGCSVTQASDIVDNIVDLMLAGLAKDSLLKIPRFGTFLVKERSARLGRDPTSGLNKIVEARNIALFRPSRSLKEIVNS